MVVDAAVTTWIEDGMRGEVDALVTEGAGHLRSGFR
jgi:hypothetical protein